MKLKVLVMCALLAGALFHCTGRANAQTPIHTTDWTSAVIGSGTAGAAGSTTGAGDGWIDQAGSMATQTSTAGVILNSSTTPYSTSKVLLRPTAENVVSEEEVFYFVAPATSHVGGPDSFLRWTTGNNAYFAQIYWNNGGTIQCSIFKDVSGTPTSLTASTPTPPTAGDIIKATFSVTGASPSTLLLNIIDTTTSTTIVSALTTTDSTSGLQTSGQIGLAGNNNFTIQKASTYNMGTSFYLSQTIATSGTNLAETAYGTGTSWVNGTTTFSSTGVSGTSISGLSINNGTQQATFTLTPGSAPGTDTISNSTDSFTAPVTVNGAATIYTSGISATGGLPGVAATITYTGNGATSATITPTVSGVTGAFSPTTIALNNTTPVTVTFTPSTSGTATLSSTNSGTLTNPANLAYSVYTVVGVTNAAFHFSPYNWSGDGGGTPGRGGTVWRSSWNNGAYFSFVWTASASPTAIIELPTTLCSNMVSYTINNVLHDNISAGAPITVGGITASASNTLTVYLRNSSQLSRWNFGTNIVQVDSMAIDPSSTAGTAPTPTKRALIIGDSITEGIEAATSVDDNLDDYSFLLGQYLLTQGYDYGISACGYSGFMVPGDSTGDVPFYYKTVSGVLQTPSRWSLVDNGISITDSNSQVSAYGGTGTSPDLVLINYGTNEYLNSVSTSDFTGSVTSWLVAMRAACPNAKIAVIMPFGLQYLPKYSNTAYVAALTAGVTNYQSAHPNDTLVYLVNLGSALAYMIQNAPYINGDNVHPNQYGHAYIASQLTGVIAKMIAQLNGRGRTLK